MLVVRSVSLAVTASLPRPQTATTRAVEVHELSRSTSGGAQILPLSAGMLHQLLKSALALEIDATGARLLCLL